MDNRRADFSGRLPLLRHPEGKKGLCHADAATRGMGGGEAVQQAAMAELLITAAIAGLLGEHQWNFMRNLISPGDQRAVSKIDCRHQSRKRFRVFRALVIGRNWLGAMLACSLIGSLPVSLRPHNGDSTGQANSYTYQG